MSPDSVQKRAAAEAVPEGDPASGATARGWSARLLPAFLFLALGFLVFPAGGVDDAHISFWPARTLAETGQILNTSGEAVEQSSSLLLVVLLALLHSISGVAIPTLGWLVGILAGLATLFLLQRACDQVNPRTRTAAPALTALSVPFVYWSFSGMETSLAALCTLGLTLCIARVLERGFVAAVAIPFALALGCYLLVRPENTLVALVVALTLCGLITFRRRSQKGSRSANLEMLRATMLLGLVLVFCGVLAAWRFMNFGLFVPHPVIAKSSDGASLEKLQRGIDYLRENPYWATVHLLGAFHAGSAIWGALRGKSAPPVLVVSGLLILAQVGFVAFSGGDWMEGGRFLMPTLPLAWLACASFATRTLPRGRGGQTLALATTIGLLGAAALFARSRSRALPAWLDAKKVYAEEASSRFAFMENRNKVHLRDQPTIDALSDLLDDLRPISSERRLWILTGQGGMVLYHALEDRPFEEVGIIDRFGLMDNRLARSPLVRTFGTTRLGLNTPYPRLLRQWDVIAEQANLPEPDVVMDLSFSVKPRRLLAARGYVLAYEQRGVVQPEDGFLSGDLDSHSFQLGAQAIFVKAELAEALRQARPDEDLPRTFAFSPSPYDVVEPENEREASGGK